MKPLQKTKCPYCDVSLRFEDRSLGKEVRCKACRRRFALSIDGKALAVRGGAGTDSVVAAVETLAEGQSLALRSSSSAPPPPQTDSFTKLGRFQLCEVLGQGAFGRVYKAYDPQLDRFVALKVPTFGPDDAPKVQRFLAEAKAAARLRHPNIVPTFDSGQVDGRYYIASQFVAGRPLSHVIAERPPDCRQAADWIGQLANALAYAHQEGIVHRDIKPDNVMLDEQGAPQIMDFGLAKLANEDARLTIDGSILGTPAYMPPEQARGELAQIGPHSDQYSLGAVLYELLTLKRPFDGPPHAVIAQVIATDPPAPRSFNKSIPPDLEAICQVALNKNIAERYPTCLEFAEDLARFLTGYETHARPLTFLERAWRWRRRNPLVAGLAAVIAVLLACVAGATLILLTHSSPPVAADGLPIGPLASDGDSQPQAVAQETVDDPPSAPAAPRGVWDEALQTVLEAEREALDALQQPNANEKGVRERLATELAPVVERLQRFADDPYFNGRRSMFLSELIKYDPKIFGRLLALRPADAHLRIALGRVFLLEQRWVEARRTFESAVHHRPPGHEWNEYASLLLLVEDREAYEQFCRRVAEELPKHSDLRMRRTLIRILTLAPQSAMSAEQVRSLAADRFDTPSGFSYQNIWPTYVALAHLRAGQLVEALSWQERANGDGRKYTALNQLVRALILLERGESAEASQAFAAAIDAAKREGRWGSSLDLADFEVLRREAIAGLPPDSSLSIAGSTNASPEVTPEEYRWPANAPAPAIAPFDAAQAKRHQAAWANHAGVPVEWTNDLGMKFALIPAGEFLIGTNKPDLDQELSMLDEREGTWPRSFASEAPQHRVVLTKPFYLGVYEVTQRQFLNVMKTNPSWFSPSGPRQEERSKVIDLDTANFPVENVFWDAAARFSEKLSQQDGMAPFYDCDDDGGVTLLDGDGYRLPSEAEWEFACRAGTTTRFWCGDRLEELRDCGWMRGNSGGRTHSVGELKANPFGLYDVHGNAWEWVGDSWSPFSYAPFADAIAIDPAPLAAPQQHARLLRGGDYFHTANCCRSATRRAPGNWSHTKGFRVVATVEAVKRLIAK